MAAKTKRKAARKNGKMSELALTAVTTASEYWNVAGSGAGAPAGGLGTAVSSVNV
ncbi:hypothetical protein [Nocardioides sp. B-3]|uniref:hypothetical protein n=1 Tax=Nocardioides sp. B-3 TaxID=2895565 RepID=UPI0021524ACE|nr:hypothetical protein [Nocardioides sp. B-3]UUZ57711.1 hypothetical protein LP418_14840 [Nocardioides sp. B-3]